MRVKTKRQVQIEQQILYNFSQIVEAAPQYTVAQHIVHFMRRKGEKKDVYEWSDEFVLSKLENYYDELKIDLINNQQED